MERGLLIILSGPSGVGKGTIRKYFEKDESNSVYEEMLEIEDWKNPNTTNVDYDYDRHLIKVNNLISNAQLPIELTKDSKYFRGYTVLNNR